MSNNNKDLIAGIGVGLGVGLIVGGVLGILFAPKSGVETRKEIKDKTLELVKRVKELPADARAVFNKATIQDIKKR
jgi:gas vesicle protein